MSKFYLVFALTLITLLIFISFLYFFAGGKTYLKVVTKIDKTKIEQGNKLQIDFSPQKTLISIVAYYSG